MSLADASGDNRAFLHPTTLSLCGGSAGVSNGPVRGFVSWAKRAAPGRGLVCHFYISESAKQYYGNTDFAYFNLYNGAKSWLVKGTTGHGIKSRRRKVSQVPCLNCFEVNAKFFFALKRLGREENTKFQFGIVLNKRQLKARFNVIDVIARYPATPPPPSECHHYDAPYKRVGTLHPFNYCDVVRIEIPETGISGEPIAALQPQTVMAMLVRGDEGASVISLLETKGMDSVGVFPVL